MRPATTATAGLLIEAAPVKAAGRVLVLEAALEVPTAATGVEATRETEPEAELAVTV